MQTEIENILEDNEKTDWQGVINRKVLLTILVIILVIFGAVSAFLFMQDSINYTVNGAEKTGSGQLPAILVAAAGLLIGFLNYYSSKVKKYAITGKRIIIKSGLIGTDFKSIYFDQIQNLTVDVGLLGKIFSVGSIKIDTGKTETYSTNRGTGDNRQSQIRTRTMYDTLSYIEEPYEVYKKLQATLSNRKESLYSGRADRENHPEKYN